MQKKVEIPENIQTYISLGVLAWIGALFVFKYGDRLVHSLSIAGLIALMYGLIYLAALIFAWRSGLPYFKPQTEPRVFLFVSVALVLFALGIVIFFPESSRVSRLFALQEWLRRLLSGAYPWSLSIQYNPSGLPFLFLMALPFYLVGNLGLLEVTGVVLYLISLIRVFPQTKSRWLPLLALFLLPSFFYELLVRSELLFNICLVIILMILSERYLDPAKLSFTFFGLAAVFGLVLSTRSVVGLVYVAYYIYRFRQNALRGVLFAGITFLFFSLTLLPFIIWDPQLFFSQGPFYMQLLHLPLGLAGLFVIAAAFIGWKAISYRTLIFLCGILLFFVVGTAFLLTITQTGLTPSIIQDGFDITYFIFGMPFFLLSLGKTSTETSNKVVFSANDP